MGIRNLVHRVSGEDDTFIHGNYDSSIRSSIADIEEIDSNTLEDDRQYTRRMARYL